MSNKEPHYKIEIPYVPYPLQREILDYLDGKVKNKAGNEYRFLIAVLGRQSGKSWLARYALAEWAINRGKRCMWVAPANSAALGHWNIFISDVEKSGIPIKKKNEQTKEIQFFGGGSVRVRSAIIPDNLRGEGLDLIIMDEAAFYRNGKYVWESVIQPMVTATGGKVLFTTTPNFRNYMYGLYNMGLPEKNDLYYRSWHMPSYKSPYQDKALLEHIKDNIPSIQWRMEYEAEFMAGGGSIFASAEEASVVPIQEAPTLEQVTEGYYVAGGDFGFDGDPSAYTVLHVPFDTTKKIRQVFGDSWTATSPVENMERMAANIEVWRPRVLHIERNGIGGPLFKLFKDILKGEDLSMTQDFYTQATGNIIEVAARAIKLGDTKIVALNIDNELKRSLVETTAAKIEYNSLLLLDKETRYGSEQLSEISTFERKETTSGQGITYAAEEGYHDDRVSALYLAVKGLPRTSRIVLRSTKEDIREQDKKARIFRGRGKALKRGKRHA